MDEVISPDLSSLIFEKVREHIVSRALDREGEGRSATGIDTNDATDVTKVNAKATIVEKDASEPSSSSPSAMPATSVASTTSRLTALERAYNHEVLYIIGKEQMKVKPGTNFFRKIMLRAFLFIRENTRTKIASLDVDRDRVIEVGFVKDV
jgi:KUP system potassium uptake protein